LQIHLSKYNIYKIMGPIDFPKADDIKSMAIKIVVLIVTIGIAIGKKL